MQRCRVCEANPLRLDGDSLSYLDRLHTQQLLLEKTRICEQLEQNYMIKLNEPTDTSLSWRKYYVFIIEMLVSLLLHPHIRFLHLQIENE